MPRNLLLVAGIAGNELWSLGLPVLGDLRVWLAEPTLLLGAWRTLGLGSDGVNPPSPSQPPLHGLGVLAPYYGSLADYFRRVGWTVWDLYQDWRLSVDRCAPEVVAMLTRLAGDGPTAIVCHSRGGLVVRAALQSLTLAQRSQLVGRVAGLGVPHQGALSSVGLLGGWHPTVQLLRTFLEILPAVAVGRWPSSELQAIVSSWPAVYELLPKPGAGGVDPAAIEALYNPATWSAAGLTVRTQWLAAARARWPLQQYAPADVQWLDVIGDGLSTPTDLAGGVSLASPASMVWTAAGDGTVPAGWQVQPDRPRITTGLSHDRLVYGPPLAAQVSSWLLSGRL